VITAAGNVVDWGRACGLAELPLSYPRGTTSPPPSGILSANTAHWISSGARMCRPPLSGMRRGLDRRRPVDISAPPRKLRKGEVEGAGRESRLAGEGDLTTSLGSPPYLLLRPSGAMT
jgi:hypothetical protein